MNCIWQAEFLFSCCMFLSYLYTALSVSLALILHPTYRAHHTPPPCFPARLPPCLLTPLHCITPPANVLSVSASLSLFVLLSFHLWMRALPNVAPPSHSFHPKPSPSIGWLPLRVFNVETRWPVSGALSRVAPGTFSPAAITANSLSRWTCAVYRYLIVWRKLVTLTHMEIVIEHSVTCFRKCVLCARCKSNSHWGVI